MSACLSVKTLYFGTLWSYHFEIETVYSGLRSPDVVKNQLLSLRKKIQPFIEQKTLISTLQYQNRLKTHL